MKNKRLVCTLALSVALIIGVHLFPRASLAFRLIISGHPVVALSTKAENINTRRKADSPDVTLYMLDDAPITRDRVEHEMTTWACKKIGVFYFWYYYGEG